MFNNQLSIIKIKKTYYYKQLITLLVFSLCNHSLLIISVIHLLILSAGIFEKLLYSFCSSFKYKGIVCYCILHVIQYLIHYT